MCFNKSSLYCRRVCRNTFIESSTQSVNIQNMTHLTCKVESDENARFRTFRRSFPDLFRILCLRVSGISDSILQVYFEITREQKNTIKTKCIVIIIAANVHVHIVCATCCFLRRNLQNPGKFGLSACL